MSENQEVWIAETSLDDDENWSLLAVYDVDKLEQAKQNLAQDAGNPLGWVAVDDYHFPTWEALHKVYTPGLHVKTYRLMQVQRNRLISVQENEQD